MPDNSLGKLLRNKLFMALVYFIALASLAYAAFDAYQRYQEMQDLKSKVANATQPVTDSKQMKAAVSDTRKVASLHLFGKKATQAKPRPQVANVPVTRLKLTLIGVVAGENPDESRAVIQIDNKQVKIFRVGDTLSKSNARIHEIHPTQILLTRRGKLEKLAIDRPDLDDDGAEKSITIKSTQGNKLDDKLLKLPADRKPIRPSPRVDTSTKETRKKPERIPLPGPIPPEMMMPPPAPAKP